MHSQSDVFAVLVSSNQFDLIDPLTGNVAASLTANAVGIYGFPDSRLTMFHRDTATSDGYLGWTHWNGIGNHDEYVQLAGAINAPAGGTNVPRVEAGRTQSGPTTYAALKTGNPGGLGTIQQEASLNLFSTGVTAAVVAELRATTVDIYADKIRKSDNANNTPGSHGQVYGARPFAALLGVASGVIGVAGVVLLTINTGAFPVTGGWLDISFYGEFNRLVANCGCTLQVFLNGLASLPIATDTGTTAPVGSNGMLSARHLNIGFGAVGAQVLTLVASSNVAGGIQFAGGNTVGLQCVQYV